MSSNGTMPKHGDSPSSPAKRVTGADSVTSSSEPSLGPRWNFRNPNLLGSAAVVLVALVTVTLLVGWHRGPMIVSHLSDWQVAIAAGQALISLGATYAVVLYLRWPGSLPRTFAGAGFVILFVQNVTVGLAAFLFPWSDHVPALSLGWSLQSCVASGFLCLACAFLRRVARPRDDSPFFLVASIALVLASTVVSLAGLWTQPVPASLPAALHMTAGVLFLGAGVQAFILTSDSKRLWLFPASLGLIAGASAQVQYALHQPAAGVLTPADLLNAGLYMGLLAGLLALYQQGFRRMALHARQLALIRELGEGAQSTDTRDVSGYIATVVSRAIQAQVHVDPAGSVPRVTAPTPEEHAFGAGSATSLEIPLYQGARYMGVLHATRPASRPFTPADIELTRAAASQAAFLLERSALQDEVAAAAVQDERSRLAREIHDGLAQHLAFLKMRVAWLRRSRGTVDVAQLEDIESVLETALVEARYAITTLRTDPGGLPTPEAIQAYAAEFVQIGGVPVHVHVAEDVPEVSAKARVELLRIVQEALNNVRKHARAGCVELTVARKGTGLEVILRDDGIGFDASQSRPGHFGVEIMRERAVSSGGRLHLDSQPGKGTSVLVWLPAAGPGSEMRSDASRAPAPVQRV